MNNGKTWVAAMMAVAVSAMGAAAFANSYAATTVTVGNARFTLLTDRMVRCEWSADGTFEDRPSLVFVNREMPKVEYTLERRSDGAKIATGRMTLEWSGGLFNESNLVVNGIAALAPDTENLLGTMRTIDGRSNIKDLLPRMEQGMAENTGKSGSRKGQNAGKTRTGTLSYSPMATTTRVASATTCASRGAFLFHRAGRLGIGGAVSGRTRTPTTAKSCGRWTVSAYRWTCA